MKISLRGQSTCISLAHNDRTSSYNKDGHIDTSRSILNKYSEEDFSQLLEKKYEEFFGEAVAEYNKTAKADRKIDNYLGKIKNSKRKRPYYEMILQIGDIENHPNVLVSNEILEKYATTFEERNPTLKVVGWAIHNDECTPHLHIDYVPVVSTPEKQLKVQNSLTQALSQMGIETYKEEKKKFNAQTQWQARERETFRDMCVEAGLDIDEIECCDRTHLEIQEWKIKSSIEDLQENDTYIMAQRISELEDEYELLKDKYIKLNDKHKKLWKGIKNILVDKLNRPDLYNKLVTFVEENKNKKLEQKEEGRE